MSATSKEASQDERCVLFLSRSSHTPIPELEELTISSWTDPGVVRRYLDDVQPGIPYGTDQIHVMLALIQHVRTHPNRVVDLGCGDGFVARVVLEQFPTAHVTLIDHSPQMISVAHRAMAKYHGRYEVRLGDLLEPLDQYIPLNSADCIVSRYAIHHLPNKRKYSLYEDIHRLLVPGGLFVNIEHVASATPMLERLSDSFFIDEIASSTGKPRDQVEREFLMRPDKADNILENVGRQLGWLNTIGFESVDCYFKCMELAVFGGVKPA
ncbi:MAG: class I SAM-dependent methyltransferase [Nitrospira sp.]|mgnify:CR=1 FL=1